jgi:D-xylulose reductase
MKPNALAYPAREKVSHGSADPLESPPIDAVCWVSSELFDGWGADVVFEASGHPSAVGKVHEPLCPGGRIIFIGMPVEPVPIDLVGLQAKEASIETTFRYAYVYPRALALMGSGKINVKPLISRTFDFHDG